MNIFVTSDNPFTAAKALDDKRVIKMIVESTQLLCTAINIHGGKAPYKTSHANHPSAIWARATMDNWTWLHSHAVFLCDEYERRYSKTHNCLAILDKLPSLALEYVPEGPQTAFANCAAHAGKGISYKHVTDVTEAYQRYLVDRWNNDVRRPTWYRGQQEFHIPEWVFFNNGKLVYKGAAYQTLYRGSNESSSNSVSLVCAAEDHYGR